MSVFHRIKLFIVSNLNVLFYSFFLFIFFFVRFSPILRNCFFYVYLYINLVEALYTLNILDADMHARCENARKSAEKIGSWKSIYYRSFHTFSAIDESMGTHPLVNKSYQ